jgi:hypothetical protein
MYAIETNRAHDSVGRNDVDILRKMKEFYYIFFEISYKNARVCLSLYRDV